MSLQRGSFPGPGPGLPRFTHGLRPRRSFVRVSFWGQGLRVRGRSARDARSGPTLGLGETDDLARRSLEEPDQQVEEEGEEQRGNQRDDEAPGRAAVDLETATSVAPWPEPRPQAPGQPLRPYPAGRVFRRWRPRSQEAASSPREWSPCRRVLLTCLRPIWSVRGHGVFLPSVNRRVGMHAGPVVTTAPRTSRVRPA